MQLNKVNLQEAVGDKTTACIDLDYNPMEIPRAMDPLHAHIQCISFYFFGFSDPARVAL